MSRDLDRIASVLCSRLKNDFRYERNPRTFESTYCITPTTGKKGRSIWVRLSADCRPDHTADGFQHRDSSSLGAESGAGNSLSKKPAWHTAAKDGNLPGGDTAASGQGSPRRLHSAEIRQVSQEDIDLPDAPSPSLSVTSSMREADEFEEEIALAQEWDQHDWDMSGTRRSVTPDFTLPEDRKRGSGSGSVPSNSQDRVASLEIAMPEMPVPGDMSWSPTR